MTSSSVRPSREELQRLVWQEHLSDGDIAEIFDVSRQRVQQWRASDGISSRWQRNNRTANTDNLQVWEIKEKDMRSSVTTAVRAYVALGRGISVVKKDREAAAKLEDFLRRENRVVTYDPETGYRFVPRDPEQDDPESIIRQPRSLHAVR